MEFVAHIESLVNKLSDIGKPIPEDQVMTRIVTSLPAEYGSLRRAWDLTPAEFKSKKLLITNIRKEEMTLQGAGATGGALAMRSAGGPNRGFKARPSWGHKGLQEKNQSTCKWCKKPGHWWKECPSRPLRTIWERERVKRPRVVPQNVHYVATSFQVKAQEAIGCCGISIQALRLT